MRLLPLILLFCVAVLAVEGGHKKGHCGKGGGVWCPRGRACRPCGYSRCCRPIILVCGKGGSWCRSGYSCQRCGRHRCCRPINRCRRINQKCGKRRRCRPCGSRGLCCRRWVSLTQCRWSCKRRGYYCTKYRCSSGYCCRKRCYKKHCRGR
ncbi:keratin-associated protein 5-8-like [Pollicipes pollicipes]|uniref:keratin-associated protein 5-8-like n=1 Tax=Pollicipes pollicipes TaxID=41117 RepID=UPI0018855253|nr:keratin-associated protein 5-8-like [Pollicipes pollicipes]